MRKLNRGFTLIELLVVVAIIGILASVGVVAYNGYTASAKKGVSKSNHANAVKFITAEIAKCGVDDKVFVNGADHMTCDSTAATGYPVIAAKAIGALNAGEFNNPFGGDGAVSAIPDGQDPEGFVVITYDEDTNTVTLTTQLDADTTLTSTAVHD
jgi:type IV pilus assembly protein PilA|tara:strand:+ start:2474 stop:2938 length:465 start_codon:yes stop_codon:yes gene_type:complete